MLHINIFRENLKQIDNLFEVHVGITGNQRGKRPKDVEVLNKSGIVLLVACWEAFVEDLAKSSFDFLLQQIPSHEAFPSGVRTRASKALRESKNEKDVWKLADSGWKSVLEEYKDEYISAFHSPSPPKVDDLFKSLVDYPKLSSHWYWQKMSSEQAQTKLNELINLRNSIAHKVSAGKSVKKVDVKNSVIHIEKLAVISSNSLREYLFQMTQKYPWDSTTE